MLCNSENVRLFRPKFSPWGPNIYSYLISWYFDSIIVRKKIIVMGKFKR